jgi:hypothetical protein
MERIENRIHLHIAQTKENKTQKRTKPLPKYFSLIGAERLGRRIRKRSVFLGCIFNTWGIFWGTMQRAGPTTACTHIP